MTPASNYNPAALIEGFAQDPGAMGKAMRAALDHEPGRFAETVLHDVARHAGDRGFRYALILLRGGGLLIPALANPAMTSFGQALRITRMMLGIEKNFVNEILEAAVERQDLRAPARSLRILELASACADQVTSWRAVARLQKRHGDSQVRSKCGSLLARYHFGEHNVLALYERGESRERADMVEALHETDPAKLAIVVERALADANNRVAGNACVALYRAGDCRALTRLAEMLRCVQPEFQATAAWAMGQTRDPRFSALLREAAASGDPTLRRAAIRALSNIDRSGSADETCNLRLALASAPAVAGCNELWVRALRPDGTFVNGLEPIDFFARGPGSPILDYSVTKNVGGSNCSVRVAWPVGHGTCHRAIVASAQSRRDSQIWTLDGYGGAKNLEASCWNLLKTETGGSSQHLAVLCADDAPGFDWKAIRAACGSRGIQLHRWRIGADGQTDVEALWAGFLLALECRYTFRSREEEPVHSLVIRETGQKPVRFTAPVDLSAVITNLPAAETNQEAGQ